jgi:hypothetical protein
MTEIDTGGAAGEHLFDAHFVSSQDENEPSEPLLRKQDVTEFEGNLTAYRWRHKLPPKGTDRKLIEAAQAGDRRANDQLVRNYDRTVKGIAHEGRFRGPPLEDRIAHGHWGLSEAIARFNLKRKNGFYAFAVHWIELKIRECVKDWKRGGQAGETRADRYAYDNPNATAEEVAGKVGCSLADAKEAIARQKNTAVRYKNYDTFEPNYDDDGNFLGVNLDDSACPTVAARRRMYDCFSRYHLSPQLIFHDAVFKQLDPDELERASARRAEFSLKLMGRDAYAKWLIAQERKRIAARAEPQQYLYPWMRSEPKPVVTAHPRRKLKKIERHRRTIRSWRQNEAAVAA